MPTVTEAGLLSALLGSVEVYAEGSPAPSNDNSQTMALLQANVSSVPILQDKNDKNKKNDDKPTVDSNANIVIVSDNALLPTVSRPGASTDATGGADSSSDQVSVYVVRKGDTVSEVADMFDVSVSTILAANDLKKGEKLVEGDTLLILPISGLKHTVTKGQTLKGIANLYKVDVSDITLYNDINPDSGLAVGDELIIPGGEMDEESDKPVKNLNASIAKDKQYYETHPTKSVAGYFVDPVPAGRKTQGLHDHGAIDIGAPTGTPIYASASGTVLAAKGGYNGGYGNMVIIKHPNGVQTLYGHMSKLGTTTGASVHQGQLIGYVGSTGKSTGPHLHFKVMGAKNPGADWSWKQ